MIDWEEEARDAYRPIPLRTYSQVQQAARRERLRERVEKVVAAIAGVGLAVAIACAGCGR